MPENERLARIRDSYAEVLDATKHQDDKIGRFLTAVAFVLAGALLFVQPEVLQARYAVGDARLPLPAWALVAFLVLVVFSVVFYLLATSAPLLLPAAHTGGHRRRSHLFFHVIADETSDSWRRLWVADDAFEERLIDEYIDETLNLAQRADNKAGRSQEASALFVLSLLFFLLTLVLSVDALSRIDFTSEASRSSLRDLPWGTTLRAGIAAILSLFTDVLIYQRIRSAQKMDAVLSPLRRFGSYYGLAIAYPAFLVATLLPLSWSLPLRASAATVVLIFAGVVAAAYFRLLGSNRVIAWAVSVITVVFGLVTAAFTIADAPEWQLPLALVAAVSPMAGSLTASTRELRRRRTLHQDAVRSAR